MSIILTSLAALIVLAGVVFRVKSGSVSHTLPSDEAVLSTTNSKDENFDSEASDGFTKEGPMPVNTSAPTPSITTNKDSDNNQVATNSSSYIYPGSVVIESSDGWLKLQSTENTDTITSWYQDKLKSNNYKARSTSKTKANDKILNKVSGASQNEKVKVEISKEDSSSLVVITVSISSD